MAIWSDECTYPELFNNDSSFWESDSLDSWDYNCGSYALDIKQWYYPYPDRDERDAWIQEMYDEGRSLRAIKEAILEDDISNMLAQFRDYLQPINSPNDVPYSRDVIAYRISLMVNEDEAYNPELVYDFHFKVRRNGKWSEKQGYGPILSCDLDENVIWDAGWMLQYDSPIKYFVVNKI